MPAGSSPSLSCPCPWARSRPRRPSRPKAVLGSRVRLFRMTVSSRYLLLAPLAAALAAPAFAAPAPKPAPAAAKAPARPVDPVVSLKLEPASLSFADRRDTRRFLVLGVTKGGLQVDLTEGSATIQPAARREAHGQRLPGAGEGRLRRGYGDGGRQDRKASCDREEHGRAARLASSETSPPSCRRPAATPGPATAPQGQERLQALAARLRPALRLPRA